MKIPFVDIFAGPGGLGEGFSSHSDHNNSPVNFKGVLSIEKDPVAARTLTLRNWLHQFDKKDIPDSYYNALRDPEKFNEVHDLASWKTAQEIVWNAELGKVCNKELHSRLQKVTTNAKHWVLLGGPPCQAYSLVGRARMTGIGRDADNENADEIGKARRDKFYSDHRHVLYKEYLRIVAIHQPSVFVMENVKGILSSKVPGKDGKPERIFPKIREDLTNPRRALKSDETFKSLEQFHPSQNHSYKLYSFVETLESENSKDRDFIIRCEDYGVPQCRHRVIILGVREDISVVPSRLKSSAQATVRDVLEGIPKVRSGISKGEDNPASWLTAIRESIPHDAIEHLNRVGLQKRIDKLISRKRTRYSRGKKFYQNDAKSLSKCSPQVLNWIHDSQLGGVVQHETRGHMPSDLGRYLFASLVTEKDGITPKLQSWPKGLLPKHKNVTFNKDGSTKVSGFHDRFRVQAWERPSTTITSHISKDGHYYIHPDPNQCRSLTVREAARLQTFPDNYYFCGNRTQQYHQVGNAVPPYLAVQLADVVAGIFANKNFSKSKNKPK